MKTPSITPKSTEKATRRQGVAEEPGVQVHLQHGGVQSADGTDGADATRAARVDHLRTSIADGTYEPDLEALASKLADVFGPRR